MPIPGQPITTPPHSSRRRVIVAVIGLLAAAAVSELLLRSLVPELGMRRYDDRFTGSHPIEVNERGFRGALPGAARSDLVLCLGDSTTYGTGAAVADTWPSRLDAASRDGVGLAVVNAAMPGTDLNQLVGSLDGVWADLHPKVIVVALTGNMVSLAWIRRDEATPINPHSAAHFSDRPLSLRQRARYLVSDSAVVGGVLWLAETLGYATGANHHQIEPAAPFGALLAYGWTQAGLDPTLADRAWQELANDLKALRDWCDQRGTLLVATWMPSRFTISDDLRDNLKFVPRDRLGIDANARCKALCESLSIAFADSLGAMRARRAQIEMTGGEAPLYVFGDYTHLDPDGHAAVADAVRSDLESMTIRESARAN